MNFTAEDRKENSPYLQLLMLLMFAIAGLVIGTILTVVVLVVFYGKEGLGLVSGLSEANDKYISMLQIAQVLTTAFLFILPPLWLARIEKVKITSFYGFKKPQLLIVCIVILIMICAMPAMEWVGLLNEKMRLPDLLKPVEQWMRDKEDEAMKMTILLLKVNHVWEFFINLFIIALLPAVAEEFIFRGAVQRSFKRMFNNPHVAIWVTAIIFSAIHIQFYGFLPRMLLGAAFGYIYLWTNSLWYTMLAHFLNNAYAVCLAWYMQLHHIPLNNLDNSSNFNWYQCFISLILTIFLLKFLEYKTKPNNGKQLD